tara:strand:- start:287 stop:550 length:264 start_codon:yes stop_codon:yes gene_type:complete
MKLRLKGQEAAAGTSTTNGSNYSNAKLVRVHNAGTTQRLVSIEDSGNTLKYTFTISGGATEFLEKDPTDEIFAANAEVKCVSVAYYS